jgi:hypothetical protein
MNYSPINLHSHSPTRMRRRVSMFFSMFLLGPYACLACCPGLL